MARSTLGRIVFSKITRAVGAPFQAARSGVRRSRRGWRKAFSDTFTGSAGGGPVPHASQSHLSSLDQGAQETS